MKIASVDKAIELRKQFDTAKDGAVKDLLAQRAEIDDQLREFGYEVTAKRGRKPKAQQP